MTDTITILSEDLLAATHGLGQNLAASEPFTRYVRAQVLLEEDQSAGELLDLLISTQNKFRAQQSQGNVSPSDLEQLKVIQKQVQDNPVIMEYADSQKAAIAYLKQINQEISQQLGMDFALIAKRSCG
jgi:cell fate (sporulation/competence/biofilm development) regulator YlbF (YheA/YmcA/DUF963 family)